MNFEECEISLLKIENWITLLQDWFNFQSEITYQRIYREYLQIIYLKIKIYILFINLQYINLLLKMWYLNVETCACSSSSNTLRNNYENRNSFGTKIIAINIYSNI